ncbi:MAG: LamG domain-containing protein [Bryobacteraceae bacterium]|jgi:Concanavalin A-like lectin/glucanases superfamily
MAVRPLSTCGAVCVLTAITFGVRVPAAGQALSGYWKFDGAGATVPDSSGNGNDATIVNARWTEGPSGGKALAFWDYANDYPPTKTPTFVRVKHSDTLTPTKGFDISATVSVDAQTGSRWTGAVVQKGEGYGCSYRLLIGKDLKVQANAGNEHASAVSTSSLVSGRWTTIRATYDGRELRIYIDGKEDARVPVAAARLESKDDVRIGDRFTGKIAEVRIRVD